MQQRRGTAAEWTAADPVLAAGEIGYETDTGKFKFGDGTNTWSNLEAFSDASAIIGAAPATLDTLAEIAIAIDENPDFYTTVAANTNAIASLQSDLSTTTTTLTTQDATNLQAAFDYADLQDTAVTSAYQLADTQLETDYQAADTTLQNNIDAATADITQLQADVTSDAADLVTHAAVTTNVHGIADTSDLALLSGADQTFSGNITVSGDFTVSGTTTTVSTQDLVVNDPMIYIGEGSTSNTADLGLVGSFDDGTYQHAGIVRDASDDIWKLFKGVTDEPSTTINFAQGSLDDLAVNNVEVAGVVFTDGTQTKVGVPSITPIAEKTAAYTLTSTDEKDTIIEVNSGSAVTLTIPEDATVNFPVGSTLDIIQTGAGQVTIAGTGSAVVNGTPGTKLRTQWSSVTLLKRAANSWLVFGDTAA